MWGLVSPGLWGKELVSLSDCVDLILSRLVLLVERCLLVRRVLLARGEVWWGEVWWEMEGSRLTLVLKVLEKP